MVEHGVLLSLSFHFSKRIIQEQLQKIQYNINVIFFKSFMDSMSFLLLYQINLLIA